MARPYGVLSELLRQAAGEKRMRAGQLSGCYLGPVRRIERVAPPPGGRYVTLVFENGPTAVAPRPDLAEAGWRGNGGSAACTAGAGTGRHTPRTDELGITQVLLETLERYGAAGTFAVIGSTAENYPDDEGLIGTSLWNGKAYDHFPEFGRDALAGIAGQPGLVRGIVAGGHELVNHTYRHVPPGPPGPGAIRPGGGRLAGPDEAAADLTRLHRLVADEFGYIMRFGRPVGERRGGRIDRARDGRRRGCPPEIAGLYGPLGYNHLAASFDGGGWQPTSGAYDHDAESMVHRVQRALEKDPSALSGQIVSLPDGYNRSRESPVVTALPRQLQMLRNYGYRVVTASELVEMSPFSDLSPASPAFRAAGGLLTRGLWVAYTSNEIRAHLPVRRGELAVWAAGIMDGPATLPPAAVYSDVPSGHPYRWHVETATGHGLWSPSTTGSGRRPSSPDDKGSRVFGLWDAVTVDEFRGVLERAGVNCGRPDPGLVRPGEASPPPGTLSRAQALVSLWEALGGPDWRLQDAHQNPT